jgi:hypothetical protein
LLVGNSLASVSPQTRRRTSSGYRKSAAADREVRIDREFRGTLKWALGRDVIDKTTSFNVSYN